MKYAIPRNISLPLSFFVLLVLSVLAMYLTRENDPRIHDAEKSYQDGETAKTIAARKQAFNTTLDVYLDLEQSYHPQFGTGKLFYNIGNTYFQLEEYPHAILYFLKAKALMPREDAVQQNLRAAQEKLGLEKAPEVNAFSNVFFFHHHLSLPERLQILFSLTLLTTIIASAYLWLNNQWIIRSLYVVLLLTTCFLLSVAYTRYFTPIDAVMIKSSDLYLDAGTQYAKVGNKPLAAGTQVEVIGLEVNGKWFKVRSPNGNPGYIPQETFRIISAK